MKIGIAIDWHGSRIDVPIELIKLSEQLGFDSVWASEAYGSDALTPLAYSAAVTRRIRLGTSVAQIAARAPAATAMAMATLDQLAGEGRVICGLGVSGPQVVEGWYGRPWQKPYWLLKDYVAILRKVWRREAPVEHKGKTLQLPYQGDDGLSLGKPLRSILHCNRHIPVLLGTGSETMVKLTAQIADGWLPFGFSPDAMDIYRDWLLEGFKQRNDGVGFHNFEIQAGADIEVTKNVKAALKKRKPMIATYIGGMGHKDMNFHKQMMIRRGYETAAEAIQHHFLNGRREQAVAAVPDDYVADGALIGSPERIRTVLDAWKKSGATGLTLYGCDEKAARIVGDYCCD